MIGSHQEAKISELGGEEHAIGPHELLSFLAPAAAAQEAHHLRAINLRQRWLRGTRFLSAEALAALVDSDDETIERRTQVFADLLGIRHLLDAEKLCDRFINDLASRERSLSKMIEGQSTEIASLIAALTAQMDRGSSVTSAAAEVEAAETKLRLEVDEFDRKPSALANRIEALNVEHARRQHILNTRLSALEAVAAEWGTREEIERNLADLTAREAPLGKRLAEIETENGSASRIVTEVNSRQERHLEHARALATAKEALGRMIVALTGAIADLPNETAPPSSKFGELSRIFPEAGWTAEALRQRQADLRAAVESQRDCAAEIRRLELLKAELEPLARQLLSEDALAVCGPEAAQLGAAASAARVRVDTTSDPIARLQAAARDLLEHTHENGTDQCPLCSHHWGSSEQLHKAIAETLNAVPELTQIAHAAASSADEAARLAKSRLDEAIQRSAEIVRLRRDIQSLESGITSRRQELDRLGGSAANPLGSLSNGTEALRRCNRAFSAATRARAQHLSFQSHPFQFCRMTRPSRTCLSSSTARWRRASRWCSFSWRRRPRNLRIGRTRATSFGPNMQ